MSQRCWYLRFSANGMDWCPNPGRWHWPDAPGKVISRFVWCDDHRHPEDVLIESALADPPPEVP